MENLITKIITNSDLKKSFEIPSAFPYTKVNVQISFKTANPILTLYLMSSLNKLDIKRWESDYLYNKGECPYHNT